MKIHNKLIKSTKVAAKTDSWGNFIITILTRTGLHSFVRKFFRRSVQYVRISKLFRRSNESDAN